jgi:hypothetical protein
MFVSEKTRQDETEMEVLMETAQEMKRGDACGAEPTKLFTSLPLYLCRSGHCNSQSYLNYQGRSFLARKSIG